MKLKPDEVGTCEVFFPGTEDNELQVDNFTLGTCGAYTQGVPSVEEFGKMLSFLVWISRNCPWWIGDLITWAEQRYGDDLYNTVDLDPWAVDQIERHAAVCRKIPAAARNRNLWYTHHREVCKLNIEDAIAALKQAEEQVMSSAQLRKTVSARPAKKKRKKPKW